jgi:hypothetical protein
LIGFSGTRVSQRSTILSLHRGMQELYFDIISGHRALP